MTTNEVTDSRAEPPAPNSPSPSNLRARLAGFDRRFPRGRVMMILAIAVLLVNGLTVGRLQFVSVVDETAWIDHLVRASKFELVRVGDHFDKETLQEICTRRSEFTNFPSCDSAQLERFGRRGNYAGHSPFYFWLTGPTARALRALPIDLPPNDSMITWARLLGSVWLLLGLYLTLRAGELLGIARVPLIFALLLVSFVPVFLHASTIVNPDVTALPAGAAVLLAALLWQREPQRKYLLWLVALSGVAVLLDETNGVAVILAIVYLAIVALKDGREDQSWHERIRSVLLLTAALFGAGVIAKYGWDAAESIVLDIIGRNGIDPASNPNIKLYTLPGSPPLRVFVAPNRIFGLFPPVLDATPPTARQGLVYAGFAQAAFFIVAGSILGRALWGRLAERADALATAALVALLVGGPLTAVYFYVVANIATAPTARFGLSALPAAALIVASTARGRFGRALLAFVAVGLGASAIVVLF